MLFFSEDNFGPVQCPSYAVIVDDTNTITDTTYLIGLGPSVIDISNLFVTFPPADAGCWYLNVDFITNMPLNDIFMIHHDRSTESIIIDTSMTTSVG